MVVGAGTSLLGWGGSPYIYSIGAVGFVSMQLQQRYEGTNFTIRRLRRIMILSDVCFLLAAVLMFANMGNVFGLSQITYVEYIYYNSILPIESVMNSRKRQKNYKRLRICFKMRKFFFILQYIVVFLPDETNYI